MSAEDKVQTIIREGRDILGTKTPEEFLKFVEKKISEIEKEDKIVESVILWNFVAEAMENLEETDFVAYAYSKLISRYLLLEDIQKAEEIYRSSIEKELSGFHLDTVRTIFERRAEAPTQKEITELCKKDVFGDYVSIPIAPSVLFENVTQVRNFVLNQLPSGTFTIKIYNHKLKNTEEIAISTEVLDEFEVISVQEVVRIE